MKIALLSDTYPPLRSSGAIQLRDLSIEFVRQGHEVSVLVATPNADRPYEIEFVDAVRIVRLRSPKIKDINYVRRTIGEFLMPYVMARNLSKSPLAKEKWEGVIWYSPSIFLGPLANRLKNHSKCNSYLIIRDIFPEWAVDMGIMGKGLPYKFFKSIANYQYSVANTIGVQTVGNLKYFKESYLTKNDQRVEVLQNWIGSQSNHGCSIDVAKTRLAGRKIFVYAGNMGVAQGMDVIFKLVESLKNNIEIGFLFVGRGSEVQRLRDRTLNLGLNNCIFFDEIDPLEIPELYSQCDVGLVSLDAKHKTNNIPGKFISYMAYGLPVLANINPGNDLVEIIQVAEVGCVCTNSSIELLSKMALNMAKDLGVNIEIKKRCQKLALELYSPQRAVNQIVETFQG
jgi:glycosyltransferase involved in cell wall biosynthesis